MDSVERLIRVEAVSVPHIRDNTGSCAGLASSIKTDGMHRPIVVWSGGKWDGTLISGRRRHTAHLLMAANRIPAVFVGNIESAAKYLLGDNQDTTEALPMKWTEVCRLWELMRRLDAPAAAKRLDEARRRGVELRRETQAGLRAPGRAPDRAEGDYVLRMLSEAFGIKSASARRVETIYEIGYGIREAPDERRELARKIMADLESGDSIWASYERLMGDRNTVTRPKVTAPIEPAPAARQRTAWDKSLPQLEGLIAGLTELGPPNPELTWDQVEPMHKRLAAARRALDKMIRQMRESNKS